MTIHGIDISNNNGAVDFGKVPGSWGFVIAKVTEGTGFTDKFFPGYVDGCIQTGRKVGGYHFARPSRNTAAGEAAFFVKQLRASGKLELLNISDLGKPNVWCDQEDPDAHGPLGMWTEEWCDRVEQALSQPVGVYLSFGWWDSFNSDAPAKLGDRKVWAASYGATPHPSAPWDHYDIWQYNDRGSVAGISGNVDLNELITTTPEDDMTPAQEAKLDLLITMLKDQNPPAGIPAYQHFVHDTEADLKKIKAALKIT